MKPCMVLIRNGTPKGHELDLAAAQPIRCSVGRRMSQRRPFKGQWREIPLLVARQRSSLFEISRREWGRPVIDDTRLFEKICLEGFQAGLSWITILRKRRKFTVTRDLMVLASTKSVVTRKDVVTWCLMPELFRHRGKIQSVINNANRAKELIKNSGSLAAYLQQWEPKAEERPKNFTLADIKAMPTTKTSTAISKILKNADGVCWSHNDYRLYAGHGHGQWPFGRMSNTVRYWKNSIKHSAMP